MQIIGMEIASHPELINAEDKVAALAQAYQYMKEKNIVLDPGITTQEQVLALADQAKSPQELLEAFKESHRGDTESANAAFISAFRTVAVVGHLREIAAMSEQTPAPQRVAFVQSPESASIPPKPTVSSQHEWNLLSPEQKAAAIAQWQSFWFRPTPAVAQPSGIPIVVPAAATDASSGENWKGPITAEQREALRSHDWKRYRADRTFTKKGRIFMHDEKTSNTPKAPIDFSSIGGTKVGHPFPVQTDMPIDFSSTGGKCVRKASDQPMAETAKSAKKERNAHE